MGFGRILLVDDERQILSLLSLTLRRAGYQVIAVTNGFEAMSLCRSSIVDAVLSDIEMPTINGHQLVRWIAGNHPNIRYALMSASPLECVECPLLRRCPFLRKPFFPRDAVAVIRRIMTPE
jgi:DNA-binding NtrC family response regulator